MLQALKEKTMPPTTRPIPMPIPGRNQTFGQLNPGLGRTSISGREPRRSRSRDLPGATEANPTGKAAGVSPVANAGAGNTGFERFLSLHRGNRGGRTMSSKTKGAFRYTGGKAKGMTQGEVDIQAHRQYQKMSDKQRDQFRSMNEGDYAKSRERRMQSMRDEFKLAKDFNVKPTSNPGANNPPTTTPNYTPPGGNVVQTGNPGDTGDAGARGKPGSNTPEAKRKRGLRTGNLR